MACACSTATSPTCWKRDLQVDFYHLTATPVERALPRIAERVVAAGGRLLVVAGEAVQREALDRQLWVYMSDSFLPHAQAGGEADADQPVLIADAPVAANGARFVALVDGVWRDEALGVRPRLPLLRRRPGGAGARGVARVGGTRWRRAALLATGRRRAMGTGGLNRTPVASRGASD